MKYSIRSDMMTELTPKASWLVRRVALCRAWRAMSWLLLPFAYLGALLAPTIALSVPFRVFHEHHFSPVIFWSTTVLLGAFILWAFGRVLLHGWRSFRQRVIYVEAIVFSLALVIAVAVVVWLYPPK